MSDSNVPHECATLVRTSRIRQDSGHQCTDRRLARSLGDLDYLRRLRAPDHAAIIFRTAPQAWLAPGRAPTFARRSRAMGDTWLCCGALVLIAWILRRTSWENKLGLLLLATFASAAALHFLEAADLIVDGLVVARYGMAAMLAIWVIHAVLGTRHVLKQPSPAEPAGAAGAAQEVVAPEPPSSGQTEPPAADSLSDSDSSEST